MWNPSLRFPQTWQSPQFSQNIGQAVHQQSLGQNQQGVAHRPPAIPQPHGVYNHLSQSPINPNNVVMTQQTPGCHPPNGGPMLQNSPQFPRQPVYPLQNNLPVMQPRGIPGPMNPQFPRNSMPMNPMMASRGMEGQRPLFLPHSGNLPYPRLPVGGNQAMGIRSTMPNPSMMHNLPRPNMHHTPMNVNSQPTIVQRAEEPLPPGTSNGNHFATPAIEPQRNVSYTHSHFEPVHVDRQSNNQNMTTSNSMLLPGQNRSESIDTFTSDHSRDQQRIGSASLDHDQMDTVEYKYGLSPPEMDSMAFTDAEDEVFFRGTDERESLRNHFSKTSPHKKSERSPLKNDYRKKEDHGMSRKRDPDRHYSSSRLNHKQPKYDNDSKHVDHDQEYSPHDRKMSSTSSEGKVRTRSKRVDHDKKCSPHDGHRSNMSSEVKNKTRSEHVDRHDECTNNASSEEKSRKSSKHVGNDKDVISRDQPKGSTSREGRRSTSSRHVDNDKNVIPYDQPGGSTSREGRRSTSSKHVDNDKRYSPHVGKRSSIPRRERNRTSSSSSNNSTHSKIGSHRRNDSFTSPNSYDRYEYDRRHHREDRPLRCVSPPAPDIKRVLKFIVPEEYYTLSKSKKDSKSVTLAAQKLEELYETFDKKILNPDSEPDSVNQSLNSKETLLKDSIDNGRMNDDDDIYSDFDSLDDFDLKEQERKGEYSADTFADANDSDESGGDEEDDDDDDKYDVDDDASDSGADECSSVTTGTSVKEVRARKLTDPRRLHPDLWFNEKGEGNDGPVCRCCAKDKERGIQHFVYPEEKSIPLCNPLGNNADRLYHYWVTVTPHTNFMTERPTTITYHDRHYVFEGFSILSHQSLDKIPLCSLIRFNIEFSIHLVREPIPMNFCIKGLEMISKFLFSDVLELLDWSLKGQEGERESCPIFHFMPRFVYRKQESQNGKEVHELLPMNKVISYLIESSEPLVKPEHLKLSKQKERSLSKSCRNQIVRRPNKKPAAFRIDDLEFEDEDSTKHDGQRIYPQARHHGIRPVQMSYSGNVKYQKLWKSFLKLRNTAVNRPVFSRKYQDRLVEMKVKLEKMRLNSSMRRDVEVKVNSQGLMKTGIHSDICQHAMLLPVLVHHLRYHISLRTLDDKIGYRFKDRMLLQLSLSHPSYHLNFGMNPDQARNTLSNCGVKQPRYGDRRIHRIHTKKKGITQLIRVMANLGKIEEYHSIFKDRHGSLSKPDDSSDSNGKFTGRQMNRKQTEMIRHNERLEFLGDAVLEFICSSHLYFMLPDKSEGHLATFRSALVQNSHLALLAKKLNLSDYMQYAHGPDLCKEEDMNHAMANCFEALLGAIFLESGLQAAIDFLSHVAFEDEEIRNVWEDLPQHPLQSQQPHGDRHLIPSSPVLQKLQELEEKTGITFNHIRLLARAFTHPQVGFNNLTLGDNQRMEFLGDSVLQFVVSVYLYKHFPEHHEGHLTLLRSSLVNNRTQADIARQLGLDEYINFGSAGPKNIREKLLADVLESFLAALYIDKGLKHVEAFCRACFFPRVEENIVNQEWIDAKSQLQQCCLTLREEGKAPDLPEYRVLQNTGPAHRKRYQIVVYYKGKRCGKGEGQSIHQAEMAAARDALSSSYFPELARQKHYLDKKHQNKRTKQNNRSPARPRDKPNEDPPVQEPLWVENE